MQKTLCENKTSGQRFMSSVKIVPFSICSWFMRYAGTLVAVSLFLTSLIIWVLVLYYSAFNDETASVLSFLGVAAIVFAAKLSFAGTANINTRLSKIVFLEFLLVVLGFYLLLFTKLGTTAFYLICLGMFIQKIRYDIRLAEDSTGSFLSEGTQKNVHCEHVEFPRKSDGEEALQPFNLKNLSETGETIEEGVKQKCSEEGFDRNAEKQIPCTVAANKSVLMKESDIEKVGNEKTNCIQSQVTEKSYENSNVFPTEFQESMKDVNSFLHDEQKEFDKYLNEKMSIPYRDETEKFECILDSEMVNQLKLNLKNIEKRLIMAHEFINSNKIKQVKIRDEQTSCASAKYPHETFKDSKNSLEMTNKANESQNDTNYDFGINKLNSCVDKQYYNALENGETNKPEDLKTFVVNTDTTQDAENESKSTEDSTFRNEITSHSEFVGDEGKFPGEYMLESKIPATSDSQDIANSCKSWDESALENERTALPSGYAVNEGKSNESALINEMVSSENGAIKGKTIEVFALPIENASSHFIDSVNDSESTDKIASQNETFSKSFPDSTKGSKSTDELAFKNQFASSHPQASNNEDEVTHEIANENGATAFMGNQNECEHVLEIDDLPKSNTICYGSKLFQRPASMNVFGSAYSYIECRCLSQTSRRISSGNQRNVNGEVSTSVQNIFESSRDSDIENIVNRIDSSFIYSI